MSVSTQPNGNGKRNIGSNGDSNSNAPPLSDVIVPTATLNQLRQILDGIQLPEPELETKFPEEGVLLRWHSKDSDDSLILYVDMPGLSNEEVTVFAEKNTLTITGQGASDDADEPVRRYGGTIDLPKKTFKLDSIAAQMRNGVLKLVIPKIKQQNPVYAVIVRK